MSYFFISCFYFIIRLKKKYTYGHLTNPKIDKIKYFHDSLIFLYLNTLVPLKRIRQNLTP